MLLRNSECPGKAVRLAYCLNLHPADTLDGFIDGVRKITLPLRDRLAPGKEFGVGMYLPAKLASVLVADARQLARLKAFLDDNALDPFTYNAFPYGGFGDVDLKERVFRPLWNEPARLEFTLDVARVAVSLAGAADAARHLSLSTHTGGHSSRWAAREPRERDELTAACQRGWKEAARALSRLREQTGWSVLLALEPEPRANCNDTRELLAGFDARDAVELSRHVGACLDTCHAAVEFEDAAECWNRVAVEIEQRGAARLGKLQFTSALEVANACGNSAAIARLFALDEPRYLHQVTAQRGAQFERVGDLGTANAAWTRAEIAWEEFERIRCHFHVPVDREALGDGLSTTRAYAGEVLSRALARPHEWGGAELHVEIETYTWDVLPREARGAGELVDGLEREYRHVLGVLAAAGWIPA